MKISKIKGRISFLTHWYKLASEKGLLLLAFAFMAMCMANSPLNKVYHDFVHYKQYIYGFDFEMRDIVNDFLMAFFFFIIGLEIKKELVSGHLATRSQRILPIAAAFGGVVVPVVIYIIINYENSFALKGWAVPAATDIAFSLGILALFGKGLPSSLRVFLAALAIIDDLVAVIIIAFFYSDNISSYYLTMIVVLSFLVVALNLFRSHSILSYSVLGIAIWYAFLKSGVHPTVAGVLFGLLIPISKVGGVNIAKIYEKFISPYVSYFILPIFAFINSGVPINFNGAEMFSNRLVLGVVLGLFVGKQLGIFVTSYLLYKWKLAKLPENCTLWQFYCISIICGIGFTMSLFVANLAFSENVSQLDFIRVGVLVGSSVSAIFGGLLLSFSKGKLNKKLA